jgi:hypothetical protein
LALEKFFENSYDVSEARNLNQCYRELSPPNLETIVNFGLVVGQEKVQFIHESFADYFIAEFLIRQIVLQIYFLKESFKASVELFMSILKSGKCDRILNFLDEGVMVEKFQEKPNETVENRKTFQEIFHAEDLNRLISKEHFKNLSKFIVENYLQL